MKTILKSKKRNQIIFIIIIGTAIIFLGLGIEIGKILNKNKLITEYQKLLDHYFPPLAEVYTIEGKIIAIKENMIIVEAPNPGKRIILDKKEELVRYNIKIDENTKITRTEVDVNPKKTKITDLSLNDLQKGDTVSIRSKENIIGKTEFTASLIDLVIFPK